MLNLSFSPNRPTFASLQDLKRNGLSVNDNIIQSERLKVLNHQENGSILAKGRSHLLGENGSGGRFRETTQNKIKENQPFLGGFFILEVRLLPTQMRKLSGASFFVLIFTFLSSQLFASPQMPDYIIFGKDTIATYNLILERYLEKKDAVPTEKLFGLSFRNRSDGSFSFNCWRGYQAIYKIENDSLFLVNIINCGERTNGKINDTTSAQKIKEIFSDRVKNNRVYINWFSGDINFPLNNKVLRWDGVFYKIYEHEKVISIAFGKVLTIMEVDNYVKIPKAIDRRDKSKISDILFKKIKKAKWIDIDSIDCSEKYLVTIDSEGVVSKVTMLGYQSSDSIDKYWEKKEYNYCINTIYNALKKLKFDIIKDKGKPMAEDIYIEIWFDDKKGKIENWTHL